MAIYPMINIVNSERCGHGRIVLVYTCTYVCMLMKVCCVYICVHTNAFTVRECACLCAHECGNIHVFVHILTRIGTHCKTTSE